MTAGDQHYYTILPNSNMFKDNFAVSTHLQQAPWGGPIAAIGIFLQSC
jgi:hypothetical protein